MTYANQQDNTFRKIEKNVNKQSTEENTNS